MIWGDLLLCLALSSLYQLAKFSFWQSMQILGISQSWGFIKKHSVSTVSQAHAKTWGSKAILLESWRPNGRSDQTQAPAPRWTWKTNGLQGAAASNDGNEDCWELVAAPAAPHLFLQVQNSCFIFSCEFSTCSMVQVASIWQVPHLRFSCNFFPFLFWDLPRCCHDPSGISWMRLSHELNKHPTVRFNPSFPTCRSCTLCPDLSSL